MPVWQLSKALLFPDPQFAEEDGLIAIGGDLSNDRLLLAYRSGIFPWFSYDDEFYWFSPDPRCVLFPSELKVSKSMAKLLRKNKFRVTTDRCFAEVVHHCATIKRDAGNESWIDDDFISAYTGLHHAGVAHSIEVWENDSLAGGLYGLQLGNCFFGESMFSLLPNASKVALIYLAQQFQFSFIDCQVHNDHLESMGARNIPREDFLELLEKGLNTKQQHEKWPSFADS